MDELANVISSLSRGSQPEGDKSFGQLSASVEAMDTLIKKYATYTTLKPANYSGLRVPDTPPIVLLTGSTGSIGSHILADLLADKRIARVYTLNRPSDMAPLSRLQSAFREKALNLNLLDIDSLVPLIGDVNREDFGLGTEIFSEVGVRHIVLYPSLHPFSTRLSDQSLTSYTTPGQSISISHSSHSKTKSQGYEGLWTYVPLHLTAFVFL